MMTLDQITAAIQSGPYAWPGGYPVYFVMADGEPMSFEAVRDNLPEIAAAHRDAATRPNSPQSWDDQWIVVAHEINYETVGLVCAHTNAIIPNAYGLDDAA